MLQLFYAIEFLIALIATFTVWSQVGGQGHLDMMAWYWKLSLSVGISYATVKATAAAVETRRAWNSRTLRWISIILALGLACAAVTYYYHITEPPSDEEDSAPTSQTAY
ncbi:MAG: hypothetical protein ABSH50_22725 [Bryobacteraceae bacterium]